MGIDATYFSKDSVDINTVVNFLKENYEEVTTRFTSEKIKDGQMETISGIITVTLPNDRTVPFFVYSFGFEINPEKANHPVTNIPGRSWSLTVHSDDECIDVLFTIAKEFGGYVQKSDTDWDGRDNKWHYISGKNSSNETLEGKIFNMLQEYTTKITFDGMPNSNFIVGFISENLDQIKKL